MGAVLDCARGKVDCMTYALVKPPRRSQAERSATTSASILDASILSLYELGYAATSTSIVAGRAGVSRGAMLHHFPTKVALMQATVQETYARDIAAYELAFQNISLRDNAVDKLIDAAWQCFKSPSGVAQTEIWMAARSDRDLARAVLPLHEAIARRSTRALSYVLDHNGHGGHDEKEAMLCYLVGALRGLSIQHVLGSSEAELSGSIAHIKMGVQAMLAEATH